MEDDSRLRDTFPDYPRIRNGYPVGVTFYKNITPQIYNVVEACLVDKGYKVTDVLGMSRSWRKPVSEMTIGEIISQLREHVDSLFVLHYLDTAMDGKFSGLTYNFSMFDVSSNDRILYFNRGWAYPFILEAISKDPSVPPGKITRTKASETGREESQYGGKARITTSTYSYQHAMPEEEIVNYALKYMRHGFPKGTEAVIRPGYPVGSVGSLRPRLESLIP